MSSLETGLMAVATGLYALHAVLTVRRALRLGEGRPLERWGPVVAAMALHTAFLVSRSVAARGLPVSSRLGSVALFLWVTAVLYLAAGRPYRLEGAAVVVWPLYALGLVGMWALASREPMQRVSLAQFWLVLHLVPVYAGYAGFAVAAGAGLTYLVQERLLRGKGGRALWRKLPALETLERVDWAALSLGFPALTLGLVAGAVWAEESSELLGRGWYADPKVVGGFVVWGFYAAVLHVRLMARLRGRRAAWLTIAGFVLTLATFVASHAYAATPESARPFPSGTVSDAT
ncbi:MAG: inner membrane protein YpjD [Candidatus Brocadiia bacterium]